jgi:hypothetical protein
MDKNKLEPLKMYIPIRDENNFMIKFYQYLFTKYWNDDTQVYFLGYKKPEFELNDNVHFISLAEKRAPAPNSWSNNLIDFFESIDDEYFLFSLEDLFIIRPVDLVLIKTCHEIMTPTIGRIDLWNSVQFGRGEHLSPHTVKNGITFMKEPKNASPQIYKVSCSNSIWNRKWFLKTLERNWSTFDWETKGNDGRNNDEYDVLTTIDRWTPSVVHALSNKTWGNNINVDGMDQEDKDKLIELSEPTDRCTTFFEFKGFNQVINLKGYQPK